MLNLLKNITISGNFFYKNNICYDYSIIRRSLPVLFTMFNFIACTSSQQKEKAIEENIRIENNISYSDTTQYAYKSLNGYWVLADYYDNIIHEQTIVKYFTVPPAFSAWSFLIKNDSLFSNGLLSHEKLALKPNSDTLAIMGDGLGLYAFSYSKDSDNIILENISGKAYKSVSKKKYTYRRVNKKEPLSVILAPDKRPMDIENGLYQIFVNHLLAGSYYTKATSERFTLQRDGGVVGFKHYNKYRLYTYFGNVHPFLPHDAVIFEDTTRFNSETVFSWELNNEILTLKEMVSRNNGKDYVLGSKVYKYVKKSP